MPSAGSRPSATSPSSLFAFLRAASTVRGDPNLPRVSQRWRPATRYLRPKLFVPPSLHRMPRPLTASLPPPSQRVSPGCMASIRRFVKVPCPAIASVLENGSRKWLRPVGYHRATRRASNHDDGRRQLAFHKSRDIAVFFNCDGEWQSVAELALALPRLGSRVRIPSPAPNLKALDRFILLPRGPVAPASSGSELTEKTWRDNGGILIAFIYAHLCWTSTASTKSATDLRRNSAVGIRVSSQLLFRKHAKCVRYGAGGSQHDRPISHGVPPEPISNLVDSAIGRSTRHASFCTGTESFISKSERELHL